MVVLEDMDFAGQVTVPESIVCAFCGMRDDCEKSAFKGDRIDTGARACDYSYRRVADQQEAWEEAVRIGRLMGECIK